MEISIEFQTSVFRIDMNIVATRPGDKHVITKKNNKDFDLYNSDYKQKQYCIPLHPGIAKHFFYNKDSLLMSIFEKN